MGALRCPIGEVQGRRAVEGQVVIHELAQIGVSGRHPQILLGIVTVFDRVRSAAHQIGQFGERTGIEGRRPVRQEIREGRKMGADEAVRCGDHDVHPPDAAQRPDDNPY